jgi:hypothetical protein
MAKRVEKKRAQSESQQVIFDLLRKRIAEALQQPDLKVRPASQLELAIGTFAPSEMVEGFSISDYPFIGSRYISARDGHVYIVAGATDSGKEVMAYRMGFIQSCFTHRGGIAVGITEDGWMGARMIMYSLYHAAFSMKDGQLQDVNDEVSTRRSYPMKKSKVYWLFLGNRFPVLNKLSRAVSVAWRFIVPENKQDLRGAQK